MGQRANGRRGLNGGCGKDGYYHREEFAGVSRKLGLTCKFSNGRYGWNVTAWPETGVPSRYRGVLELLRKGLPWGLAGGRKPCAELVMLL